MLLSPQSRKYPDGYATCSVCYTGMQPHMASKKTPPKFAIANGFVIGCFPQVIKLFNKEGQRVTRKVEDDELTDTLKAMVAPLRPYGCVFAYSGGAQKSLRGNYQFFEMDQNRVGGGDESAQSGRHWRAYILCAVWQNDTRPKTNSPQKVNN
jgi:hypothetical protein